MKEIWKDVVGYEGLYQVSNLGRVKSLNYNRTGKEKIMKCGYDKDGYIRVLLTNNKKERIMKKVHRLVAQAFIPNPYNLPMVNHKDENPSNNIVSNLEWCDAKYNNNYGNSVIKRSKQILQIDITTNIIINIFPSMMEIQRKLNIPTSHICSCCKGRYKTSGGYKWSYKESQG